MNKWEQLGEDFAQKYEGTYCRYLSPLTKKKEIFTITGVGVNSSKGPDLTLFNSKTGELYLNYDTDVELDFSFPEARFFQHENKAMYFHKLHQRQWKKGVCSTTARIKFPYNELYRCVSVNLDENILDSAYQPLLFRSITDGVKTLKDGGFSVVLNADLSLGLAEKPDRYWLWFHSEIVGFVQDNTLMLYTPEFKQEIEDFIRDTRDNVRVVQTT